MHGIVRFASTQLAVGLTVIMGTSMSRGVEVKAEKYDRMTEPYIQRISGLSPRAKMGLWPEKKTWKWPLDQRERCWKQLRTCTMWSGNRGVPACYNMRSTLP
jgi:hypothetical protein